MNINNSNPRKIRCVANNHNMWGSVNGEEKMLEIGKVYTLEYIWVSSFFTIITLSEFPGVRFNSVLFEEID